MQGSAERERRRGGRGKRGRATPGSWTHLKSFFTLNIWEFEFENAKWQLDAPAQDNPKGGVERRVLPRLPLSSPYYPLNPGYPQSVVECMQMCLQWVKYAPQTPQQYAYALCVCVCGSVTSPCLPLCWLFVCPDFDWKKWSGTEAAGASAMKN